MQSMLWSIDGDDDSLTLLNTMTSQMLCSNSGNGKHKCSSTDEKRWYTLEDGGKCGKRAPPIQGKFLAVCDPDDPGCGYCSKAGYCEMGDDFCKCEGCVDYGENPDKINQPVQIEPFAPNRGYRVKSGRALFTIGNRHLI